ncbi:hypothetical protein [Ferrovibrio sp.]|jgi:hypothetical protein|uniref:hypothetical protein n=1 Tax=Ferrovibrio sp. TaxID=1917215 RepID=UPI0035B297F0
MTTISSAYGYTATILAGTAKPASEQTGSSGTQKPVMVATDLRQDLGVEVTLSPAALRALAEQAKAAATPDEEEQITQKMKDILSAIFLTSAKQAEAADTALPPLTGNAAADTARKAAAKQASDFIDGKAANPFRGKTATELAAVIVDAEGKYTVNERRAAFAEFARQDHVLTMDTLTPKNEFEKKANDAEVPPSGTTERLASARKATDFLNGKGTNPFAALNRDQLTAIIANDGGDYTVNERRAALARRDELEKAVLAKAAKELSYAEKAIANNESVTGTPERVERARLATRFLNGWDKTNPFAGLTRDELNAIVFDETKSYTTNEQRAAFAELKQYLPANAIPEDPKKTSTDKTKTGTKTGTDKSKTDDPYNTQGAYSPRLMQQVMRANNTQYLLGLFGGGGSFGGGLSSYIGGSRFA